MNIKKKRKKSYIGWAGKGWNLCKGVIHINHWDICVLKSDCYRPVKVKITIEEVK